MNKQYQQIDNFGASDAWTCQYLGSEYSDDVKEYIADLLFSKSFDSKGNPIGIGLSLWRFNIGAGSHDNPNNMIENKWRMTECFLDSVGNYDFINKQKGQLWFLNAAKKRGCEFFHGFCNSAPWFMTKNKQACNIDRDLKSLNLPICNYDDFADFLSKVYWGIYDNYNISFDYISPLNEPEWGWNGLGQEGTPCSLKEMSELTKAISFSFKKNKVPSKIILSESGEYSYMHSSIAGKEYISNQIDKLYNPLSDCYIGNLYGVEKIMAGHSYWTGNIENLEPVRLLLNEAKERSDLKLWQSEFCIMSNDYEVGYGNVRDYGMNTALYVARIIHYDMTVANVSAWHWWTAISPEDYKDGLIYIEKDSNMLVSDVKQTKLLWALGNYSRFIRPGAVRIEVLGEMSPKGLMLSSFLNSDNSLVTVVINYSDTEKNIVLNGPKTYDMECYITSCLETDNMRHVDIGDIENEYTIPSRSVITFVSKLRL